MFSALLFFGCNKTLIPLSGEVKLAGVPISDCRVVFMPKGEGVASVAVTDNNGRFVLRTLETKFSNGIKPGEYLVLFSWNEPDGFDEHSKMKPPYTIPNRYSTEGIPISVDHQNMSNISFELIP